VPALDLPARVEAWHRALAGVRAYFVDTGLRETTTPVRVPAPAIEPYIEPIAAGDGARTTAWLHTSPELAMKRQLCGGSGPIFQIAHVFRGGERGALHAEEFHLVEWYRTGDDLEAVMRDVEQLVSTVFERVGEVPEIDAVAVPSRWERVELLDLMEDTLGSRLPAQGDVAAVFEALSSVREEAGLGLDRHAPASRSNDAELDLLLAWTELFSLWSDLHLDPWLRSRPEIGVHVVGFPAALAALSAVEDGVARRFESHACGFELANGYGELRDAEEQRRRFERVNALRRHHGGAALPLDEVFFSDLASPGLPACCGCALGLDRLLMLAVGARALDDIRI
jgi:lysyl-tRNA synthetase class 2